MKIYYKIHTQIDATGLTNTPDLLAIGFSAENGHAFYGQSNTSYRRDKYVRASAELLDEDEVKELIINRKKTKAVIAAEFEVNQQLNEFLDKFESVHLIGSENDENIRVLLDVLSVKVKSRELSITNLNPSLVEENKKKIYQVASYLPETNALKHAIFHQYICRSNEKKIRSF